MKKILRNALCVVLCGMLMTTSASLAFAQEKSYSDAKWENENDLVRIREFFSQTDPNGVSNGDKAVEFTHGVPGLTACWFDVDNIEEPLVGKSQYNYFIVEKSAQGGYCIDTFQAGFVSFINCYIAYGDFYGTFDLSDTSIRKIDADGGLSSITSVNLNNCTRLREISGEFPGAAEIHAVNTALLSCSIGGSELRTLEIQPDGFDMPITAKTMGNGGMSFVLRNKTSVDPMDGEYRFVATDKGFIGWYINGLCVTKSKTYIGEINNSVDIVAIYTGDADGDGEITASDALRVMRASMGIDIEPMGSADLDGNGIADMADALSLMRFTMGL